MSFNSREGFTLMELMVYIALLGGIVLIAGRAFSDSTKMRVRTQSMLQASQTVGNVGTILKDDIAQLGAKSSKGTYVNGAILDNFDESHISNVYMDPNNDTDADKDSSSFHIWKNEGGTGLDRLAMRRLRYTSTGLYDAVEQISWFVENRILKRSCKTLDGNGNTDCPSQDSIVVTIAENVDKFTITPATPGATSNTVNILPSASTTDFSFKLVPRFGEENFEPLNIQAENENRSAKISGFAMNYDFETSKPITNAQEIKANQVFLAPVGDDANSWSTQCTKIYLAPYIEYEISFSMPIVADDPSRMFCPGRDHMAVGFRYAETGQKPDGLNDFQFYPPTVGNGHDTGIRTMRFTTTDTIKQVCLGFTFASFSPVASSGNIHLDNITLKKIPSSNYTITADACNNPDNNPCTDPSVKKNVKAIQVEIAINKNGETGTEKAIVPIPSNGPRD